MTNTNPTLSAYYSESDLLSISSSEIPPGNSDDTKTPSETKLSYFHFLNQLKQNEKVLTNIIYQISNFLNNTFSKVSSKDCVELSKIARNFISDIYSQFISIGIGIDNNNNVYKKHIEKFVMLKLYNLVFFCPAENKHNKICNSYLSEFCQSNTDLELINNLELKPQIIDNEYILQSSAALGRIGKYKSPSDKLMCIINACKFIQAAITQIYYPNSDSNKNDNKNDKNSFFLIPTDLFLPVLIYVLSITPASLLTDLFLHIHYISNYHDQELLFESGGNVYIAHIYSALTYIENNLAHNPPEIINTFSNESEDASIQTDYKEILSNSIKQLTELSDLINTNYINSLPSTLPVSEVGNLLLSYQKLANGVNKMLRINSKYK